MTWNVQVNCATETYGSQYCAWTIQPDALNLNSIIYCFGVGDDASFDLAIIEKFGAKIFAFDPTPRSIDWVKQQNFPENFRMHPYGIASFDGEATFHPSENPEFVSHTILDRPATKDRAITLPVFRLTTIMNQLGHEKIDLLKLDIEGAEYEVIDDILQCQIPIAQILVEFHHRFPNVGWQKTQEAIKKLNSAAYSIFAISDTGEEYSFIQDWV